MSSKLVNKIKRYVNTAVWLVKHNGWKRDTQKGIRIKHPRKKAYYTNKNMMVQSDTGKHQEEREVLAKY